MVHGWNGSIINVTDQHYGEWLRRRAALWSGRLLDPNLNWGQGQAMYREYGQNEYADINGDEYAAFITRQIMMWNEANMHDPIRKGYGAHSRNSN